MLPTVNKNIVPDDQSTKESSPRPEVPSVLSGFNTQESQTQLESQSVTHQIFGTTSMKRKASHPGGASKRIKVSLADAVDLEA